MSDGDGSLESVEFRRGPGGRPTRREAERRHRELLETTKRLLLQRGWEGTSIDEISRQSGVAKRFLYARYPDKAALFFAAIAQFRDEQIGALGSLDPPPDDIERGLLGLARQMFDLAMRDETLAIVRLFIAEAPRIRDYAKLFAENFPRRGLSGIVRFLTIYAERGALTLEDPQLAAEQLAMLVIGAPQRRAMLGHRDPPDDEARRLRAAVKLFLDGCRRKPARPGAASGSSEKRAKAGARPHHSPAGGGPTPRPRRR
jgi:TetR/AcrR family transcriptional regulator, mexJK operon transcriptional repressor